MVSIVTKKSLATTPGATRHAPRTQSGAAALKGVLASNKGKGLTFAQIRKTAAAPKEPTPRR